MEAHNAGVQFAIEKAAQAMKIETGRPIALRQAIMACRPGGTVSVPGVYGSAIDAFPMGAFMNKGLTMRTGQTHVQRYMQPLFERIMRGEFNPEGIVTHRPALDDAPRAYKMFRNKEDNCEKVVLKP